MLFQKCVHNLMLADECSDYTKSVKLNKRGAKISNMFMLERMPLASLGKQLQFVLLFAINVAALSYIPYQIS